MYRKKILTGIFVMIFSMSVLGSQVFAQGDADGQPEDIKEIVVELHDDFFRPDVIRLTKGEPTKLLLKNVGVKEHTFTVDELKLDIELEPGKEKAITIEPDVGTYDLICRYHQQEGMVGKIIVE